MTNRRDRNDFLLKLHPPCRWEPMQAWSALEPILCLLVKSIEVAVLLRYISDISCQIKNANFQYPQAWL